MRLAEKKVFKLVKLETVLINIPITLNVLKKCLWWQLLLAGVRWLVFFCFLLIILICISSLFKTLQTGDTRDVNTSNEHFWLQNCPWAVFAYS